MKVLVVFSPFRIILSVSHCLIINKHVIIYSRFLILVIAVSVYISGNKLCKHMAFGVGLDKGEWVFDTALSPLPLSLSPLSPLFSSS